MTPKKEKQIESLHREQMRTYLEMNILRRGIAEALTDCELGFHECELLRTVHMPRLQAAISEYDKAREKYYGARPYFRRRPRRLIVRAKKAKKTAK